MSNLLQKLDARLAEGFSQWNVYTTLLIVLLLTIFLYPVFFQPDTDIHPLLLARQSVGSRIRHFGVSAAFRALDAPHSYPLRSGLNVKDAGQPRWQQGRDGDLRDIWRRAVTGPIDAEGKSSGGKGKISVVLGKQEVITHEMEALSKEVNAMGKHLKQQGGTRVAIYLPNTVEFLVALFACTFNGLTPILIPHQSSLPSLSSILKETEADSLIVSAGAIPLAELVKLYTGLKQVVWVVARTSRHVDWHEVPEGEGGKTGVSAWHEIIEGSGADAEVPTSEIAPPNVVTIAYKAGEKEEAGFEVVELTQGNIAAAISAQLSVLPRSYASTQLHHLRPSDTLLSLAPLTDPYPLILTLSALYSNASLALNSIAGPSAAYASAFQGLHPTVLVALPSTLATLNSENESNLSGTLSRHFHRRKLQLLKSGTLPKPPTSAQGLRLIYTYDNSFSGRGALTKAQLDNLRVFTRASIIYAHTSPKVAGAVTQTHMLDYQDDGDVPSDAAHVGPPLSCLEIKLKAKEGQDVDDEDIRGKPVVSGPAVVGGTAELEEELRITGRRVFVRVQKSKG